VPNIAIVRQRGIKAPTQHAPASHTSAVTISRAADAATCLLLRSATQLVVSCAKNLKLARTKLPVQLYIMQQQEASITRSHYHWITRLHMNTLRNTLFSRLTAMLLHSCLPAVAPPKLGDACTCQQLHYTTYARRLQKSPHAVQRLQVLATAVHTDAVQHLTATLHLAC
jgi:hypothetical protein